MRKFKIPESITVNLTEGGTADYTFNNFLNDFVWVDPYWRNPNQPKLQSLALELMDFFKDKTTNNEIELTDEQFFHLVTVASCVNKTLPAGSVNLVLKFLLTITSAQKLEE